MDLIGRCPRTVDPQASPVPDGVLFLERTSRRTCNLLNLLHEMAALLPRLSGHLLLFRTEDGLGIRACS